MVHPTKPVLEALARGRAILVAGQDLVRGDVQRLVGGLEPPRDTLRGALSNPTPSVLHRTQQLRLAAPETVHVEIAQIPWALVVTSAIDTRLATALEAAAPTARRVRRRFVDDAGPALLTRSPTVLEVMHLSLISKSDSFDGGVPDPARWARVSRLGQPRILENLRAAIGPAHLVIIDGVTEYDAVDREDLLASLVGLDDAQIVLFEESPAERLWLTEGRPRVLVVERSLGETLRQVQTEQSLPAAPLLSADDVTLSVRVASSAERVWVAFRAEEIRDVKRHLEIVGDAPDQATPVDRDDRLRAFRAFIRTPRLRSDYRTFYSDFCLERNAYTQLLANAETRLATITGTARPRTSSSGPIMLEGFPGSGRTTGLHWLAVKLRQMGWFVAHLASPSEDIDLFAIEQIVRLIERRLYDIGATPVTVILADGLGRENTRRLDERLRRAGRRAVVIGTAVASSVTGDLEEGQTSIISIRLPYQLEASELAALERLLTGVGISVRVEALKRQAGIEGFLGMLDRLDSEAQEGVIQVLRHEFERYLPVSVIRTIGTF